MAVGAFAWLSVRTNLRIEAGALRGSDRESWVTSCLGPTAKVRFSLKDRQRPLVPYLNDGLRSNFGRSKVTERIPDGLFCVHELRLALSTWLCASDAS